jgi:energy-coupling factor transporter ATP-binding protein EcfA2
MPLIASATATFLFRQFFLTMPDELTEAARIDGAGPDALLPGHPAAAVAHQHRGAVRHPVHLWLEPVPLAAADHHRPALLHHRHDGISAHGPQRGRFGAAVEPADGHRDAGHAAAGAGGVFMQRPVRQAALSRRRSEGMAKSTIVATGKSYGSQARSSTASTSSHRGRRVRRHRRPLGLRQVHPAAHGGGAGDASPSGTIASATGWSTSWSRKDRDIAMVFQNYALYPHMSVYENMAYGLKIRGLSKAEIDVRVQKAAKILQLGSFLLERKPRQLSGGQRQRVAMGRAIVREPGGLPVRRAAVQPRRQAARADAARDQATAARAGDHLHLRHPRPGRGHDPGRQADRHERRRRRADRHADGRLRAAGLGLRRRLHRLASHELPGGQGGRRQPVDRTGRYRWSSRSSWPNHSAPTRCCTAVSARHVRS